MDIKKLLSKSQVQLCLFSLGFSFLVFHPWFIPHQGMDHSFSRTCGHLHAASSQHYYFQAPALETRGLMRSEESPSPSSGIRRAHPMPLESNTGFSSPLQTYRLWSLQRNTLLSLCVFSALCWTQRFSVKNLSQVQEMGGKEGGLAEVNEVGKTRFISSSLFK